MYVYLKMDDQCPSIFGAINKNGEWGIITRFDSSFNDVFNLCMCNPVV